MDKSPDAFRTISEVAEVLDTPAHVLRFWESRFPQIRPVKRAGGRRYYRPSDVALLSGIKRLLHDEGLTIRGVQKLLRDQGARHVAGLADATLPYELADTDPEAAFEDAEDDRDAALRDMSPGLAPAPLLLVAEQPSLPLFAASPRPESLAPPQTRALRDDATLASLIRACPRGRMREPADVAALARRLATLRQSLVERAEGGFG
jgi:DNA-binding transcriptional MerR regulator